MLRKFLFVSLSVITLASCKKDKDEAPSYHLSAKIDGVKKDFNTVVAAEKDGDAQSGFTVFIVGIGGTTTSPLPAFDLSIYDDAAISAKTYTAAQNQVDGSYTAAADAQNMYDSDNDFSVTITSVTATDVKGTFSGKVDNGSGGIKNITEGTFTAKFQ